MKFSHKILWTLVLLAIILVANTVFAQSCPMCKESMTQAGKKLSDGFYYSIITMAFLPMGLVSGGAVFVIRSSYLKRHPDSTLSTFGIIREVAKEKFSKK
jgi:hypothetical protein